VTRLIVGAALMPTSALMLVAAATAAASLTSHAKYSWPFLAGAAVIVVTWVYNRYFLDGAGGIVGFVSSLERRAYVLGHELTHALAAWSVGAKVHDIVVTDKGGHVDLSKCNAFIALAPYCVPIYTLAVVAGYKLLLYLKPGMDGRLLFLGLMGASVSFHLLKTGEAILDIKQPDLPAAGGVIFSLSWILLFNGLILLLVVKALFPAAIDLGASLQSVTYRTLGFWSSLYAVVEPLRSSFVAQLRHP
jgi:hypothetical protein